MRIGIIETGVAGSVLAEMLLGAPGIEVLAFDRLSAGEEAEAGTGLNVGPNAMKALRLHLPARAHAMRAVSWPWRSRVACWRALCCVPAATRMTWPGCATLGFDGCVA